MSDRLELAARSAVRRVFSSVGTPPVSLALVALAAVYLATGLAWRRLASDEGAHVLVTSFAYSGLAFALLLDASAAVLRALPLDITPQGRLRLVLERAAAARALVRAGYLMLALAFTASLWSRDRFEVRAAVGEEFAGMPEQFVARDPPRGMSPGPIPVRFRVEDARVTFGPAGVEAGPSATLLLVDREREKAGPARPVWLGFGRFLRPVDAGVALRFEIARNDGGVLDSAFAKLDLFPVGEVDSFRSPAGPHRIYVSLASVPALPEVPALRVAAYRGKLRVAEGEVPAGGALEFEGFVLRFPEARAWITFSMLRDPGIPIALFGAGIAGAGLAVGSFARRREAGRPHRE